MTQDDQPVSAQERGTCEIDDCSRCDVGACRCPCHQYWKAQLTTRHEALLRAIQGLEQRWMREQAEYPSDGELAAAAVRLCAQELQRLREAHSS